MLDKMKQLMEVKRQADILKKELESSRIEVNDVRGIKLVINGAQGFQSVALEGDWGNLPEKAKLESELLRAVNAAVRRSQELAAQKMRSLTGLNLPGM